MAIVQRHFDIIFPLIGAHLYSLRTRSSRYSLRTRSSRSTVAVMYVSHVFPSHRPLHLYWFHSPSVLATALGQAQISCQELHKSCRSVEACEGSMAVTSRVEGQKGVL
jgi:hypothetical protein